MREAYVTRLVFTESGRQYPCHREPQLIIVGQIKK